MKRYTLTVNGKRHEVEAPPVARLLDVLREDLRLTGSKEGCGEGECGACSVLMDGKVVNSCLIPITQCHNREITTVEGIASDSKWKAVPEAFVSWGGAQCGICTPGMVMATVALLSRQTRPTLDDVRHGLAGNLCRCTGYMKIFDSVNQAAAKLRGSP